MVRRVLTGPNAQPSEFFYRTHDPTTVNKQGGDTGTRALHMSCCLMILTSGAEYRSAIFFNSPEQREIAKRVTAEVQKKHFDPKGTFLVAVCILSNADSRTTIQARRS